MNCPQQLLHVIKKGDNLYQLSKYYKTTVPMILNDNLGIDPYNLGIGKSITICPGNDFTMQSEKMAPAFCPSPTRMIALKNKMRLAWEQHVYWTRMVIISITERLKDQDATVKRLLRNPKDLADIFARYYSKSVADEIQRLVTEHLQIGGALITATRDRNVEEAAKLNQQWYKNADEMSEAFSRINPYYNKEELRKMFYRHLDLTKEELAKRLAGDHFTEIKVFDNAEQEILGMADYFANGIINQFPQEFS